MNAPGRDAAGQGGVHPAVRGPAGSTPDAAERLHTHSRRRVLTLAAAGSVVAWAATATAGPPASAISPAWTTQTLEAFADTVVPGARRHAGDRAVAGAVQGPGAVQAGAIDLLRSPALPLAPLLPGIGALLNTCATAYAVRHLLLLDPLSPSFVELPFRHRTELTRELLRTPGPDRPLWQALCLLVGVAFDTAGHLSTASPAARSHPGLAWIGFPPPGPDGLWRHPQHAYPGVLASRHPSTTPSGSPA
ncbi:DUF5987 family protein [Streptomyces sp. NPDC005805]|uniref:DUF5987 family protein n=1 Tax=Streptomyces sp. NPDC005805 TaxID=3157068 RepID=UPI0033F5EDAF